MPQVLTTNAQILCPHGGKGTSVPSMPYWSVNGGFVLLEGDVGTLACPFILCPCVGYTLKSMGLNATTINGRKVILATDFNQSFTGLPLAIVETHQVMDDTSPAPLPAAPSGASGGSSGSASGAPSDGGGAASGGPSDPPLPPEMMDMVKPIVEAVPPMLSFNSITMMPATLLVTFTLISGFPMQWMLTLINGVAKINVDMTSGAPPGLIVAPAGGRWRSPTTVVTMTLTAPFMASLGPGSHDFFMTGVSKRGLSGFAKVQLTVS